MGEGERQVSSRTTPQLKMKGFAKHPVAIAATYRSDTLAGHLLQSRAEHSWQLLVLVW